MFSSKKSCIRRFHALGNSIIVLDEVQTVPTRMLGLFVSMINFLTVFCKTTVLLCSATQPNFAESGYSFIQQPLEIVPYERNLWSVLERTKIKPYPKGLLLKEIPRVLKDMLTECQNILVVCNKKSEVEYLYNEMKNEVKAYFLTSSMCQGHRIDRIDNIRQALDRGDKFMCVSTQLIQAGVDISFSRVVRFQAGLDDVIQAAGRCNRNGEKAGLQPVYIIDCVDESLNFLKEIENQKRALCTMLLEYKSDRKRFDGKIDSDKAISRYYDVLYGNYRREANGYFEYPIREKFTSVYSLLSQNEKYADEDAEDVEKYFLRIAPKMSGDYFSVFNDYSMDVIVPYKEGESIIRDLCSERSKYDYDYARKLVSKTKPYTVSLWEHQIKKLSVEGGITRICNGAILVLSDNYYSDEIGVDLEGRVYSYLEI